MDTYTILLRFNQSANRGAVGLALLFAIAGIAFIVADRSFARVERAYEIAGRV
jgi:hypothetical protein